MKQLSDEIAELVASLQKLDKSVMEATEQRKEEHEEFTELMASDNAAKELLGFAKNRLNKFYNPKQYKAPPKRDLDEEAASFVQINEHNQHKSQKKDDPGPPPELGSYSKKGEESTGVIGMIDMLIRDLDKEMTEAEAEEKNAQKEYEDAMDDAAKKRAADVKAMAAKEKAKADAEEIKTADVATKKVETKEMMATEQYIGDLHSECDWLLQNFDLRKQARADEADNLKQAKAILSGADFSLAQAKASPGPTTHNLRGQ